MDAAAVLGPVVPAGVPAEVLREEVVVGPALPAGAAAEVNGPGVALETMVPAGAAAVGAAGQVQQLIETLGPEDTSRKCYVYLGTFARVLPNPAGMQDLKNVGELSRAELAACIRDAWNNLVAVSGPRRVSRDGEGDEGNDSSDVIDKMAVVREAHADGDVHCHVALRLSRSLRFRPAKAALLQRHKLVSHWSCSHSQFWSAVRYVHIPSAAKPAVDLEPYAWTKDGSALDLFAESQKPYTARALKPRREVNDTAVAAEHEKPRAFTKMDLTAIILDQGLSTKAAAMKYAQDVRANPRLTLAARQP
jgi:hypothetical protein